MKKIKILIPVYNDWQSVFRLLENIDFEISTLNDEFSVIVVNDASTEDKPKTSVDLKNLKSLKIINMKKNKGHARCNASGLKYINEKEDYDYIIPMDGDGEDRPEEISLLVEKIKDHPEKVVTAERVKRSEGPVFKFCYLLHKYLTFIFTGQIIKYGNYTCIPKSIVRKLVDEPATWSSFSGSLAKVAKDKKRKEAAILFDKGGRRDLLEKENQEKKILQEYLPEQVSASDLKKRIQEVISELGIIDIKDLGKVMRTIIPEFKGRADNEQIKNLVTECLNR